MSTTPGDADTPTTPTPASHEETPMDPDRTQPLAADLGLGTPEDGPLRTATAPATPADPVRDHGASTGTAGDDGARDDGVRVGTVVWGLVLAAVGVGLIALASGLTFDVELAVIVLIAAAGAALLVGSIATAARRRRAPVAPGAPGAR